MEKEILTDEYNLKLKEEKSFTMNKVDEINRQIDNLIAERSMYEGMLLGIDKSKEIYDEVIEKY